jgi:hypothetical protein
MADGVVQDTLREIRKPLINKFFGLMDTEDSSLRS